MSDKDSFEFSLKRPGWPLTNEAGYSPGKKSFCPKCNSIKISIFFKPGFLGIEKGKWCEHMHENNFKLCDDYNIIKKSNYNPNWICKDCHNCGVILK